ncbi:MAG: glutamate--tRNA ligase family protein [Patescibacteria group bacterium]
MIITRFAPSPTGLCHLGTYRTAIFAYLFARKNNGKFIYRSEDTDKERSKKEYEEKIIESLHWLGLDYDQFFRQSENIVRHKFFLEKMVKEGSAYISREKAKNKDGIERDEIKAIIRFKNPNIDITFKDLIKGEVTINTTDLGDFVIAKNFNEPIFHLAVVVDDFEEGVTHVIRAEEHVSNTPRQILIQRAIGAPTPIYAHLPLVLGPDKLKLSKRRGALAAGFYKELGFMPAAIFNCISLVGWNPGTEQEIFSKEELIENFDFSKVQKSPAMFNEKKLEWFNKEYMKMLNQEEIKNNIFLYLPKNLAEAAKNLNSRANSSFVQLIFERITKWSDVTEMAKNGELNFFFTEPNLGTESKEIILKNYLPENIINNLNQAIQELNKLSQGPSLTPQEGFSKENIKEILMQIANTLQSRGELLHPIRYSLSGLEKSPDPFIIAEILGKVETLSRLKKVVIFLT